MPNPQNLKKRKSFKKNDPRINRKGRPKLVSHVLTELKQQGYEQVTGEQVKAIYETVVNLPEADLKKMLTDISQPMLTRILVKAVLSGKGFDVLEKMIDRAQGKPLQQMSVDLNNKEAIKVLFPDDSEIKDIKTEK